MQTLTVGKFYHQFQYFQLFYSNFKICLLVLIEMISFEDVFKAVAEKLVMKPIKSV